MKKLFLIYTLLMATLVACNSSKKSCLEVDNNLQTNMTRLYDKHEIAKLQSNYKSFKMDSVWHNTIMKFRIYDTSRYDSATKSSPVVAEGSVRSIGTSTSEVNMEVEQNEVDENDEASNDITSTEENSKIRSDERKSIFSTKEWAAIIVLYLILLLMIVFVGKDNRKIRQ